MYTKEFRQVFIETVSHNAFLAELNEHRKLHGPEAPLKRFGHDIAKIDFFDLPSQVRDGYDQESAVMVDHLFQWTKNPKNKTLALLEQPIPAARGDEEYDRKLLERAITSLISS